MTPQEIVSELDRHIIGQQDAKRAVAIALRNRWRRQQVDEREEEPQRGSCESEIRRRTRLRVGQPAFGARAVSVARADNARASSIDGA